MTPEQESNRERRLSLLEEKLSAMKREGWDRDNRLLRAERQITLLWSGLALIIGVAFVSAFWQAAAYSEDAAIWDWAGIVFAGAVLALVLREAVHAFQRNGGRL
jgi:hypothetical protein